MSEVVKSWLGVHPGYRKYAVALAALLGEVANLGVVSGQAQHILTIVLSAATAIGVRVVPNTPAAAPVAAPVEAPPAAPAA